MEKCLRYKMAERKTKLLQVKLLEKDINRLDGLIEESFGATKSDIVRTALALLRIYYDKLNEGYTIQFVRKDDKSIAELIIPYK